MSAPSQLEILPPDQAKALLSKRRFWKKTMMISALICVIVALAAVSGPAIGMIRVFSGLKETGAADPSALAGEISTQLLIALWSLPPACLAFLLTLVSGIRLLCLPKAAPK